MNRSYNSVLCEQRVPPSGNHIALLSAQAESQSVAVFDFVAEILHYHKKLSEAVGVLNGAAQVRLQHGTERGLSPQVPQPLNVADGLRILPGYDNGQAVFPAQTVADGANLSIAVLRVAVILFPSIRIDGIPNQMRVDVLPVNVDADDRLKAGQMFRRELLRNFKSQFRRSLPRLEGR